MGCAMAGGPVELPNQVGIVARRLALQLLQSIEDCFDAIDGGENEGYFPGNGHAVPKFAHQRFGGVSERLKPRQSKKSARSFDGMDEAKNIAENLAVIGLSLKAHQLRVDVIETLGRLGQKLTQQVVHERLMPPTTPGPADLTSLASTNAPQRRRESVAKGFNFGCGIGESGPAKVRLFVNRRLRGPHRLPASLRCPSRIREPICQCRTAGRHGR